MKAKFFNWVHWAVQRPIVLLNIGFLLILGILFVHLMTKPIDVLVDWKIETTNRGSTGQPPTYYPGGTLEFISSSTKLISAEGVSTRIFDCDAIGNAKAREILLAPLPATRAPGVNAPKENSLIVPAINEFNGLPRTCRLVINVCYQNVILWRDHCETARSNDFLVKEEEFNAASVQKRIDDLERQIDELKARQANVAQSSPISSPSSTSEQGSSNTSQNITNNNTTTNNGGNTTNNNTRPPEVVGIPLVDGIIRELGL